MYDYSILPNRIILCVDLRSFYASVSCIKMGLDPMYTKLAVVGDVNRNGSIVLAATPPLKALGVKKMARLYEIPRRKDILVVNPIMGTYIKCSNYITKLALQYVPIEDFHQYSIDEFFMDITDSIHLFANDPYEFALKFKREIYAKTRIECTIGIGPNPLMSKVALDIEAKKNQNGIAYWKYEDVPTKLWGIRPLNTFWGISYKTEEKLNRKGIHSIGDLANYPLKYLKQSFGKIGEELHLHSYGIDFSRISEKYVPATTSVGKSQILMRDYTIEEFPIILLEHIEEVCYRLRGQNKLAQTVQFSVGYSKTYNGGIRKTHTLSRPTNLTMDIYKICTYFLHQQYTGEPIRSISISLTNLIQEGEEQISLFDNLTQREQEVKLTKVMDEIRTRFGKNSILRGISYTHSATARYRNTLIGGHKK
ncbi:Y-family DNA polymerase [Bacillus thuringiensis]|uniref:Y-family DNA polymerase n=3 Tax=Bacillus thuringiensis TaxID=1428 RepID=UPI000B442243|nr:Y-family DNA polymerase [Bacillus thuringiensis]QUW68444.1 Y-family DNA polymerase [Pseudomonas synxantha]OTW55135.1 DNA repair protein [Bacillus thuringiensis serovar amagiensis]OTW55149.1 DNA repair protein [Bacillus thuringiensis serovar amagiensis]OTZ47556.1 DNA repair protein [Bacillus thuringiensis serovar wuhanensis]OTZ48092.1 DNA repair protein [Bacillus thuringiensis serovar wuhanensis]